MHLKREWERKTRKEEKINRKRNFQVKDHGKKMSCATLGQRLRRENLKTRWPILRKCVQWKSNLASNKALFNLFFCFYKVSNKTKMNSFCFLEILST